MNYRDYKEFTADTFYHVFNRGTAKTDIFLAPEDYEFFLHRVRENLYPQHIDRAALAKKRLYVPTQLPPNSFDLICYCLMPNHFHFLLHQNTNISISKLIGKLCTSYSKYFNAKYKRVGSLLQDQFKAVPVKTNEQLMWLSAYIHRNPLEAGLVKSIAEYPYSSYPDYIGLRDGTLCKKDILLNQCGNSPEVYNASIMGFDQSLITGLLIDED